MKPDAKPPALKPPILYLITSGRTTFNSHPSTEEFQEIIGLVRAGTRARVDLIQLREKRLSAHVLFELTVRCAAITRGTNTRLLVNDRADIAHAAGADGVHLTTQSIAPSVVRNTFGEGFMIGVSTHSIDEATAARDARADFVVFGPVFETPSKAGEGSPAGTELLRDVSNALSPFPIVAIGGIDRENALKVFGAGAAGIATIRLFNVAQELSNTAASLRELYHESKSEQRYSA